MKHTPTHTAPLQGATQSAGGTATFTDNRLVAQQQQSIQLMANNAVAQLAVTINPAVGASPAAVQGHRNLIQNRQFIFNAVPNDLGLIVRAIEVFGVPGFRRNVGNINGGAAKVNVQQGTHTEPILIGNTYGVAGNPAWPATNGAVDVANAAAAGRANFNLFTERHPCGGCNTAANLQNARYVAADQVNWAHAGDAAVAASHIPRASAQFPGWGNWHVVAGDEGLLRAYREEVPPVAPPVAAAAPVVGAEKRKATDEAGVPPVKRMPGKDAPVVNEAEAAVAKPGAKKRLGMRGLGRKGGNSLHKPFKPPGKKDDPDGGGGASGAIPT